MLKSFSIRFRSTLLHLRFPFSFFLLPSFLMGLVNGGRLDFKICFAVFVILHLLVFPASNGFNSFYDQDEGSIGGLEYPPQVNLSLLVTSWILDILALIWSWQISGLFFGFVLTYGTISKLYSHPAFRWKARPFLSWFIVVLLQGFGTSIATRITIFHQVREPHLLLAISASFLIAAGYPLSQIYQHAEDERRGDFTISRRLGLRGTFYLASLMSGIVSILILSALAAMGLDRVWSIAFIVMMILLGVVMWRWQSQVLTQDPPMVTYRQVRFYQILATCLFNLFFLGLCQLAP